MKLLTNSTAPFVSFEGEKNESPSLTVPDQALTPQELLRRFANGQPFNVGSNPVYDDDYDLNIPEFYKMDKLDKLHMMQENSFDVKELYHEFSDIKKKETTRRKNDEQNVVNAKSESKSVSDKEENSDE